MRLSRAAGIFNQLFLEPIYGGLLHDLRFIERYVVIEISKYSNIIIHFI